MFRGAIIRMSIATRYGASGINAPICNFSTYQCILFVMVPFVITLLSKIVNQVASLRISFF
jgi:hypothetical protein